MHHLKLQFPIGFQAMDEKEMILTKQLEKMTTCSEFLEAVKKGDEKQVLQILDAKPTIIVSRDPMHLQYTAIHYAVDANNYSMLRLLNGQPHVNFDLSIE